MDTRPRKRQRLMRNPFVDDVAETRRGETDEEEGPYANEEGALIMEEEEDEEDEEVPQDTEGRHASLARLRDAFEQDERAGYWESLLERATARSQWRYEGSDSEDEMVEEEEFTFKEGDALWEIGCRIGHEDRAVYEILKHSITTCLSFVRSAFAHPSIPGRIYAEVSTIEEARQLANTIGNLNTHVVRPVPSEELGHVLRVSTPVVKHQSWVRVRGVTKSWKHYRSDVGLVETTGQKNILLLIPRIPAVPGLPSEDRPAQALARRETIVANFGPDAICDGWGNTFLFQDQTYTDKGLLMVDYDGFDAISGRDILPSMVEWKLFKESGILGDDAISQTECAILASRLKPQDRVKIVGGSMHGLLGIVAEVCEGECVVHIPSQDLAETIPRYQLRADFRVGDEVKVVSPAHAGLIAWVIGANNGRFKVMNLSKEIELEVDITDLQFHSSDVISSTLRPRNAAGGKKLGGRDPNEVYIGKRVTVVWQSPYKGYKGLIKTTTPNGMARVELDARLQQQVEVPISHLAIALDSDESLFKLATPTVASNQYRIPQRLSSPPSPPRTPLPTPSGSSNLSPAWDPSSQTPANSTLLSPAWDPSSRTPMQTHTGPHWLKDSAFSGSRVKLRRHAASIESEDLEFQRIQDGLAVVRDGMKTSMLEFDSLEPVLATAKGQLVTPITGSKKGHVFLIRSIDGDKCQVYTKGTRKTQANPDLPYRLSDLAQIYPPLNRT